MKRFMPGDWIDGGSWPVFPFMKLLIQRHEIDQGTLVLLARCGYDATHTEQREQGTYR